MGEEAATCPSLSDHPRKRARNSYTATNAHKQKANDSNNDSDNEGDNNDNNKRSRIGGIG
jgi:hypothetical protein